MSHLQSKNAALFVYLAWGTRNGQPILDCDQVRQAAFLAIVIRTRSHLCQVLAIDGTAGRIHLVVRFPPSLSISLVARIAQEASGEAIARQAETVSGRLIIPERLWERDFLTHTLPQTDEAGAKTYLQSQIAAEEASMSSFLRA